jgi:hypothetical protein
MNRTEQNRTKQGKLTHCQKHRLLVECDVVGSYCNIHVVSNANFLCRTYDIPTVSSLLLLKITIGSKINNVKYLIAAADYLLASDSIMMIIGKVLIKLQCLLPLMLLLVSYSVNAFLPHSSVEYSM